MPFQNRFRSFPILLLLLVGCMLTLPVFADAIDRSGTEHESASINYFFGNLFNILLIGLFGLLPMLNSLMTFNGFWKGKPEAAGTNPPVDPVNP